MNTHRKGSRWRRAVHAWFEGAGFHAISRGIGYAGDDITVTVPLDNVVRLNDIVLSIEAKDVARIDMPGWLAQARDNATAQQIPVVVAHRKGKTAVDDGYVILAGVDFLRLLTLMSSPCQGQERILEPWTDTQSSRSVGSPSDGNAPSGR